MDRLDRVDGLDRVDRGSINTNPDRMVRERRGCPRVLGSGLHLRTINTDLGHVFISCRGSYCSGNRERCMMVHKRVSTHGGGFPFAGDIAGNVALGKSLFILLRLLGLFPGMRFLWD